MMLIGLHRRELYVAVGAVGARLELLLLLLLLLLLDGFDEDAVAHEFVEGGRRDTRSPPLGLVVHFDYSRRASRLSLTIRIDFGR